MSDGLRRTRENLVFEIRPASGPALATERVQWLSSEDSSRGLGASFLGDLQVHFAFRSAGLPDSPLVAQDLEDLDLNVQRTLAIACLNFKRSNGTPIPTEFAKGVYVLRGVDADAVAGFMLERAFWRKQLERFTHGVVVAAPKRGTLYFADAADADAVQALTTLAAKMLHTAGAQALSRLLYQFGDKGWRVQATLPPAPQASANAAALPGRAMRLTPDALQAHHDLDDDETRLQRAASGQKLVILTIVANLVLRGVERQQELAPWVVLGLTVAIGVVALVGTVRMCTGLRRLQGEKIAFMVMCFVPLLNILSLIYLSMKTTRLLRDAGRKVGLLGARP